LLRAACHDEAGRAMMKASRAMMKAGRAQHAKALSADSEILVVFSCLFNSRQVLIDLASRPV